MLELLILKELPSRNYFAYHPSCGLILSRQGEYFNQQMWFSETLRFAWLRRLETLLPLYSKLYALKRTSTLARWENISWKKFTVKKCRRRLRVHKSKTWEYQDFFKNVFVFFFCRKGTIKVVKGHSAINVGMLIEKRFEPKWLQVV